MSSRRNTYIWHIQTVEREKPSQLIFWVNILSRTIPKGVKRKCMDMRVSMGLYLFR